MRSCSRFEQIIRDVFSELLPDERVLYNHRPDWLTPPGGEHPYEIDIFYPQRNLAIEVNGIFHKAYTQRQRDDFKSAVCKKRKINLIKIKNPQELATNAYLIRTVERLTRKRLSSLSDELVSRIVTYTPSKYKKVGKIFYFENRKKRYAEYMKVQNKEKGYGRNSG